MAAPCRDMHCPGMHSSCRCSSAAHTDLVAAKAGAPLWGKLEGCMQMVNGLDGEALAGRVLMQLGSPDKAVTEAVKEVIRILKKTQAASVPQVGSTSPATVRECLLHA